MKREPSDAAAPTRARLFVTAALATGATVDLDARAAHYLTGVLRLKPGAEIAVFNGRAGEFAATLVAAGKRASRLEVLAQRRPQPAEPDVWLLFAPVKRARIDLIAEKATELGVTRLCPVITRYTVVTRVNVERLRAIAVEAAEQCERLSVPTVEQPVPLETALARWPAGRSLLVGDEAGGGRPLAAALVDVKPGQWAVLVGPEGGFAEAELDALRRFQFVSAVGLGPRVLRADTAVTAALAVVQSLIGDWGHPPRS